MIRIQHTINGSNTYDVRMIHKRRATDITVKSSCVWYTSYPVYPCTQGIDQLLRWELLLWRTSMSELRRTIAQHAPSDTSSLTARNTAFARHSSFGCNQRPKSVLSVKQRNTRRRIPQV